jgi:serine/threonine-protein kinase
MIGEIISHFRIVEELGHGGMGVIYKAEDINLGRTVALKFLPPHLVTDPEVKDRFIAEAKAASALDHNNICTVHEIGETEDGQLFIAMACYDGESLKEKLERGPLRVDEAIDLAMQVAEGLAKAHDKEIVHRDIKPANVMVTVDGVAKIVDFGLAKLHGRPRLTETGTTMGTIAYMSPEQARGEEVDHRTDIWSMAVVLFEMLTGQHPFRGEYDQAVVFSILNDPPEPLTGLRSGMPMELERIINKAMAKDPGERYQHVDEMFVDLRTLKKSRESGTSSIVAPLTRPRSKKQVFLFGGISLLLIVIVGVLIDFIQPSRSAQNSIAVLPFENLSKDIENEYFSDGITEDIIAIMQYKNTEKQVREIGEELNVAAILKGSFRQEGNQLRIVANLIDVSSEALLWAETYDQELTQIFDIQRDVAKQIAGALKAQISTTEQERIESRATENLEAYDLYLKGRHHWNRRLPDDLKKGIEYFEQALDMDSTYALAYSGLADSYTTLGNFNVLAPEETYPKAKAAASKALEIDSDLAEAHASLALAVMYNDWDWTRAEEEFRRAIELNPGYALAHGWYALFLTVTGRFKEATKERERAKAYDPLSVIVAAETGLEYYFEKRFGEAIQQFQKTLEMDPLFVAARIPLGGAYIQESMYKEAMDELQWASIFSKGHPISVAAIGYGFAVTGRKEDALIMLELLEERSSEEYIAPYFIAVIHVGLGNDEEAFEWLERAYEEKDGSMVFLKVEPLFDSIRRDARFAELLKKMDLAD